MIYEKHRRTWDQLRSAFLDEVPKGRKSDVPFESFVENLLSEISYLESELCAKTDGHEWQSQEPTDIINVPWEECARCGSCRVTAPRAQRRYHLTLVSDRGDPS